jgi:transcriptional regulator with XRE-family HTH domain
LAGRLQHYDTDYSEFLERLRAARKSAGLRQADVAIEMGRAQSWVSKIESGELRVDFIEMVHLARLYNKPLSSFEPRGHESSDPNI